MNSSIAFLSLVALVFAIVAGRLSKVNVGIVALALAWLIGGYGLGIETNALLQEFPISLFTVLLGVTLLFGQAMANGTLHKLAALTVRVVDGKRVLLPLIFFVLAFVLSMIGPGNIGAVALLAPLAMSIAAKAGISAFWVTIMIANGANAGAFSPFAPTGIIANGLIERIGISMNPWHEVFLPSLLAQTMIALLSYFVFAGLQLWRRPTQADATSAEDSLVDETLITSSWTSAQFATLLLIAVFVIGVAGFKLDAGFLALTLATVMALINAADQETALTAVPWDSILLVCGMSVLVSILALTGGIDLFITWLATIASTGNVTAILAFSSGVFSVYSSSSGVVMPTFISLVPDLIDKLGGGNPTAMIAAINVGSHLVDVSPLSTLGALCIANAGSHEDKNRLFRNLLFYGLSMSLVGALVSFLFFR